MFKALLLTMILAVLPEVVSAAIIHVPADQPTIQAGIDAAVDGDTVIVADGTYTGDGNRDIDFKGKAITVTSENGPETCIIDCQGSETENHRGFSFHSGEDGDSILTGFTVQNGAIYGSGDVSRGGGIFCEESSPTITYCILSNNTAATGGGLWCGGRSSPTVSNCIFSGNWVLMKGGGYYCSGSSAIITCCIFSGNKAWLVSGGGIYCASSTRIAACTFTDNISNKGGGIDCATSHSTITNCTFSGNIAWVDGGGIYSSYSAITNCTFTGNRAVDGCGIYVYGFSSTTISNCILWNDTLSEIYFEERNSTITYSLIQGGNPGIGNIDADPMFLGGDPFDFHLSSNSPCIDAGTDRNAPTTDLEGNPRPQGGAVDMGAYEYQDWPSLTRAYITISKHSFIPGDTVSCSVSVWNAGTSIMKESPLFVILDVFGSYYCAPRFSEFDHYDWTFFPGLTELTVLPEFTWPEGVGSASGMVWYAFLMNPEMTELVGGVGVFDFGWGE